MAIKKKKKKKKKAYHFKSVESSFPVNIEIVIKLNGWECLLVWEKCIVNRNILQGLGLGFNWKKKLINPCLTLNLEFFYHQRNVLFKKCTFHVYIALKSHGSLFLSRSIFLLSNDTCQGLKDKIGEGGGGGSECTPTLISNQTLSGSNELSRFGGNGTGNGITTFSATISVLLGLNTRTTSKKEGGQHQEDKNLLAVAKVNSLVTHDLKCDGLIPHAVLPEQFNAVVHCSTGGLVVMKKITAQQNKIHLSGQKGS